MQALVAAVIAVVIVLIGVYLPFSPVAQERVPLTERWSSGKR